jgi:tetratricopeptide (TPR) repeat protein
VKATFEVESLRQLALADVRRFHRTDPRTGEQPFFHLPGQQAHDGVPRGVEVRTLLGRHLLHKSIDRLESILFMTPDDAEAAYALSFCYSINEPDIYRPERADEMLRKAYTLGRGTELEALALDYFAQIDFEDHNGNGQLIEGREAQAIEHIWFVFVNMPEKYRGREWLFLRSLGRLHKRPEQNQALADLLIKAVPFAEGAPPARRKMMGMAMQAIAMQLVRQAGDRPELKAKGLELLKRWAEGEDKELAYWGRKGLTDLGADTQDPADVAAANVASAALIVDLTSQEERDRRDGLLIEAAKLYRQGGDPMRALKLLESFDVPIPPDSATQLHSDLPGLRQFEIGCCYEALDQPDKALASFLHATRINPTVASRHEVIQHIEGLGGVPLDKDRDVDVKYLPFRPGEPRGNVSNMHLAAVGQKIYAGDQQGVRAFDVASRSWAQTSFPGLPVTCLKGGDGQLFAGTKSDGLWQCDVSTGTWRRVCPLDQLPDPHVESLALDGRDVYLGVGTKASGGLVRIDGDGNLHVFNERGAPAVAPTHIVLAKHRVLVCTAEAIYEWSMIDEAWLQKEAENHRPYFRPQLFAGSSAIWMSQRGRELTRWQASDEENARFRPAWYIPANNTGYVMGIGKAGYPVFFFAQRGDEVWYGGEQWLPFVNSGLYRFNLKTGDFHRFSPADGFRPLYRHSVYDGLWLNDRLWLATAAGLCVVTPVGTPNITADSRPADANPVAGEPVPSKAVADGRDGSMAPQRTASAGKAKDGDADAPAAEAGGSELAMMVTLEADAHDPLKFVLKDTYPRPLKTWDDVVPGEVRLGLPKLENGRYWLEITANGYALQRFSFEVTEQGIQVAQNRVGLYRRRYVVLRYAVNKVGERNLTGADVKEGRVAISVASVPDLHGDWSIHQVKASPTFRFHRMAEGYGFASPPAGASFDKIDLAPHPDQYTYDSVEAKKGMILLNRIEGNGPAELRYAKILVEDITETPPKEIQVIDSPLHGTRFVPQMKFAQPAAKAKIPAMDESSGQVAVGVRLEDGAHSPVSFELRDRSGKTFKAWDPQEPGDLQLSLPGLLHDGYVLIASAKGYIPVGLPIKVSEAGVEPTTGKIALYRVRYLVVRYAMNSAGERELTGANVKEGRVAITVGRIPELQDWDVGQSDGQVKAIIRRVFQNTGFAPAPKGASFDNLDMAPAPEDYRPEGFTFEKNMILFNHVVGSRPHDARYAKLMVEDITETRPKNLEIIDNSRRK